MTTFSGGFFKNLFSSTAKPEPLTKTTKTTQQVAIAETTVYTYNSGSKSYTLWQQENGNLICHWNIWDEQN